MIRSSIKKGLKAGLKKVLRVEVSGPAPRYDEVAPQHRSSTAPPPLPTTPVAAPPAVEPAPPAVEAAPPAVEAAPPAAEAAPPAVEAAPPAVEAAPPAVTPAAEPAVEATSTIADSDDTAGGLMTMEAVQDILDDMVRPALQGDGGDISLIRIEDNNIYVRLVGSCSSCPSSIMTMKMGVEALLKEEFPMMEELIQVE